MIMKLLGTWTVVTPFRYILIHWTIHDGKNGQLQYQIMTEYTKALRNYLQNYTHQSLSWYICLVYDLDLWTVDLLEYQKNKKDHNHT